MYRLVPSKKEKLNNEYDYIFKDFDSFYKVVQILTVPFGGKYNIAVVTEDLNKIKEFIKNEASYEHLNVYIILSKSSIDKLSMENQSINVESEIKPYQVFLNYVSKKNLLFDKNLLPVFYASIDHDETSMENAVNVVYNEYGDKVLINEKMLASLFILNKSVYPRTVLLAYLQLDRYRGSKLNKCLKEFGNDLALGACIKNIKQLVKEKAEYYSTGKGSYLIKNLSTKRIEYMYQVLVTDRQGVNDLAFLFSIYERGINLYDFIQE